MFKPAFNSVTIFSFSDTALFSLVFAVTPNFQHHITNATKYQKFSDYVTGKNFVICFN